jgi:hypothetical protein
MTATPEPRFSVLKIFSRRVFVVLIPLFLIAFTLVLFNILSKNRSLHDEWLNSPVPAIASGFAAIFILIIVAPYLLGLESRGLNFINDLIQGADSRPSTSKLQFFWWTVAVVFSFAALKLRQLQVDPTLTLSIPPMVMAAMGTSAVTAVAAKALAVNEADKKNRSPNAQPLNALAPSANATADSISTVEVKPTTNLAVSNENIEKEIPPAGDVRYTVTDDAGNPDLTKIQLLAWTVIAIALYLWRVVIDISATVPRETLPDIDLALVVLTGLSQGTYLGRKLVPDNTPWLLKIEPEAVKSGEDTLMKVTGQNFGSRQNGSMITIDTNPVTVDVTQWSADKIIFKLKSEKPAGTILHIGVVVGGQTSANALRLPVTAE